MNTLIQYIDNIDTMTENAEISVMESMIRSYDKSIMIIQEANDDTDLSAFDIFQEGEKWDKFKKDTEAPVFGNKGESLGKRLLMIIPRLIQKLVMLIRKLFKKNKSFESKMDKDIADLKKNAEKVVDEPLTEEQSEKIAKKVVENAKAAEKSNQQVQQSAQDLENTRNRVNDSIASRHAEFRNAMADTLDRINKTTAETERKSHDNQKALNELEQMIQQMGEGLEDDFNETKKDLKSIGNMVQDIDKKNPELIDELLETLGEPPRKKEKVKESMIEIRHTSFFGVAFLPDNQMENHRATVMNIYTEPLLEGFKTLKSRHYSFDAKEKYRDTLEEIYYYWLDLVNDITHDQLTKNTIRVKVSEAVQTFEQMKQIFENDVKESKKSCDVIDKLIKEIKDEYDKFNETVIPGHMGESQGSLLTYLKDVSTVLINLVEIVSACLEGWQIVWDTNYKQIQNALNNKNFMSAENPTLELDHIPISMYADNEFANKLRQTYQDRWRKVPMPRSA